ncbi:MAG TPA: D-glycerate dehydrogenase [Thermohalobaculum sp.]|nr:D-glycerate dehydrogenase [Thermohalobaculum sp.]
MTRPRVICTRKWPERVEAELGKLFDVTLNEDDEPMSAEALRAALDDYDAVCPTVTDRVDATVLAAPRRARILGQFGVGYNNIDIAAAKTAGLAVTNTPGVLTDATADIALTLLLNVSRRTWQAETMLREGAWTGWRPTQLMGTSPQGKVLGIIGMGRIGQAMAKRCHRALGMEIVFFDAYKVTDPGVPARQLDSIEEVLKAADFVSLHAPGGGDNVHLIDAGRLRLMKPTAYLINSARGDLIDEAALIEALLRGRIAGAGLDVFEGEPQVPEALRAMKNVTLFPHLGSATTETREAMGMTVLENLTAFFDGREPPNRVA